MASAAYSEDLTCPVCRTIFADPVTLLCGHSVCRECIAGGPSPQCTQCERAVPTLCDLPTSLTLKRLAEKAKEAEKMKKENGSDREEETYKALEDKTSKDLDLKQQSLEALQAESQMKVNQMEDQIHQKDTEILDLSKTKDSLSEKLTETQSQLSNKGAELLQSIEAWQETYKALEDKTSKDLDLKQQSLDTLQDESQMKVNQIEDQIHQKDTEILDLSKTKDSLSEKLTDTENQLNSKGPELLQSIEAWQETYKALEDKTRKDLELKQQSFDILQAEILHLVDQMEDRFRQHISVLVADVRRQVEDHCHRKDLEILDLSETKDSLSEKLTDTENQLSSKGAELLQSNEAWQEKYKALEDKTSKELKLKQQSLDTLQAESQMKVNQMEDQIHQKDTEILDLSKTKDSLSEKLTETENQLSSEGPELLQNNEACQETYKALEDKTSKDLELNQQRWDELMAECRGKVNQVEEQLQQGDTEILYLNKEKDSLSENLTDTENQLSSKGAEFLQSIEAWQEKYKALEDKTSKDLKLKQQSLDTLQAEILHLVHQMEDRVRQHIIVLVADVNLLVEDHQKDL